MPFVLISTQIRLETGPTFVGDELFNPDLATYLGATLSQDLGNNFKHYVSDFPPRIVLNKLAARGYRVVASSGIGQTCTWTLYKEGMED